MCPCHHIPAPSAARKHHFHISFHPSSTKNLGGEQRNPTRTAHGRATAWCSSSNRPTSVCAGHQRHGGRQKGSATVRCHRHCWEQQRVTRSGFGISCISPATVGQGRAGASPHCQLLCMQKWMLAAMSRRRYIHKYSVRCSMQLHSIECLLNVYIVKNCSHHDSLWLKDK